MRIETLSTLFAKALPYNSQSGSFTPQLTSAMGPTVQPTAIGSSLVYGFSLGDCGAFASNRLMLLPYGEGEAGSQFSVRIWGWRDVQPIADPNRTVWIPYPILEILCSLSNMTGLPNQGGAVRLLTDQEHLCDSISVSYGSLGLTGFLSSPAAPGSDLTAFVIVEMSGARKYSFDFQQVDPVTMNLFFAAC